MNSNLLVSRTKKHYAFFIDGVYKSTATTLMYSKCTIVIYISYKVHTT